MKAMFATTTLTHKEPLKEQSQHKGNQNQKSNSVQITQHPDSAVPEASAPLHFSIMGANTFCFSIRPVWAGFIWHATEIGWTNTETSKKKQLITWGSVYTHTHTHTIALCSILSTFLIFLSQKTRSHLWLFSLYPLPAPNMFTHFKVPSTLPLKCLLNSSAFLKSHGQCFFKIFLRAELFQHPPNKSACNMITHYCSSIATRFLLGKVSVSWMSLNSLKFIRLSTGLSVIQIP